MKVYHFLLVHSKFEVKIPIDGSKPPPKNPNSLASEEFVNGEICDDPNLSLVNCPPKKSRLLEGRPPNVACSKVCY